MFILVPVLLLSSAATICLSLYCKTRKFKEQETLNNVTRSRPLGVRTSGPSIYIVPTTNQVMEMYINQNVNNSARQSRAMREQCKPPPDYEQVADVPPSYEETILRVDRNGACQA